MLNKKLIACIGTVLFFSWMAPSSYGQTDDFGQFIQINTRFSSFVGKPIWLIVIRDVDHNQNIPYLFDIKRGENTWVIFTYSRNYLIVASRLQIETYQSRYNQYKNYRIHNFCQLESHGRIIKGQSMYIMISGDLSPNSDTYSCNISTYTDAPFSVVQSAD